MQIKAGQTGQNDQKGQTAVTIYDYKLSGLIFVFSLDVLNSNQYPLSEASSGLCVTHCRGY